MTTITGFGTINENTNMTRSKKSKTSAKLKMSEMISEMAAGFLGVGDTIGERQNRLNAACTAWNMACGSPEIRQRQLEQYRQGYLRFNPATSPEAIANILKDMELLVERKLNLFPDDKRQIVDAMVVKVGNKFRIEVASATFQ
jgi:hypothetical protein